MTKKQEKEQEILKFMHTLDLTREEAEQLWEDDHSDEDLPEVQELTKKAKENIKHYEKSDKTRKKSEKPRKVDEEKKRFLDSIRVLVEGMGGCVTTIKNEAELSYTFGENSYTIKLIKHRPEKV